MLRTPLIAGMVIAAGLLTSCGGGESTAVEVTLQEFAIIPAEDTVSAGSVTFDVTNDGPNDPHELVVVKTDLDPSDLPTTEEGGVDEAGDGIEVIGEVEEFPPGETQSGTFDLEAGSYVLICNVVEEEEGTLEAHYALGMRIGFSVA